LTTFTKTKIKGNICTVVLFILPSTK